VVIVLVGSRNARERIRRAQDALEVERAKGPWTASMPELEAAAQNNAIPGDWEPVLRACQSERREQAITRGRWLREAEKASQEAHDEWVAVRRILAEEWVA
jgi:hypothetical protein